MIDVLIAGGGYVGLSLAVSLKKAAPHLDVMVVDAAPEGAWKKDERASAIASAAERMLEILGVWQAIVSEAEPILRMVITDSKTADPVRPVFLTFEGDGGDGRPFAHMVPNTALVGALRRACDELGVSVRQSTLVESFKTGDHSVAVTLAGGEAVESRLLVACDGVRSRLREAAGIKVVEFDYGQSGIVTTVEHERPHGGTAEEHFLPAGPFATLPLKDNRSSLVWTESTYDAERLVKEDDFIFEEELERRFGHKLGRLKVVGGRRAFPLGLTLARDFVASRFALAGDAAHGIHPISGQGLNLGFKDVAALAETIVEADRLGLDIGSLAVLERYQTWRRFDTFRMGVTTDVLNRLFSNDIMPVRVARDFGLGVVDRMPSLKKFFIRQAAGAPGRNDPRLLAGEPI
ncbi:ubiquinone biosynthesis hydroxylase [Sinorhizobium medicae]|uniref:Ubiquinone biosynthesis hydroxylase, UbiH/UbiF/VisC/COQ6 family n=1 Tax=Sinorhizobium medicae TaxID=110321 RepID=A0A508X3B9_9HYPH|nr:ubiquinone biosynthesis hydroxylase [Sinorhizobium medicae]MDX0423073.1 ubiquinone biosynthesis hydroxylase [Sinorhizobium medicae]MDX0521119.1 ubiquinone biosynthesis hydroxylase [Sinorhizobium medicae]MDX0545433.1 ubiquinone biosynthesis hydroxylase [Sinorhizobium medicae]MDX0632859.1 ubiquinone biosynthesis hydroxylase [Sinorhizobium medicae]MDX0713165.1 ubiquinone biosynthesis hydroxylase [Sinorhizobium medicae]